jgi:single-strand DNA-binding protein
MYQQITLIGNLGQDPEMRYTPGGDPVTSFSLATSRTWLKDGVKQEKTIWFRITAWRKLAETSAQYLSKGRQVMIVGELEDARPWTDKDGNNRASLEVTAQTIKFLGQKGDTPGTVAAAAVPANTIAEVHDEMPF